MKITDITPDMEKLKEFDNLTNARRKELTRKFICNSCDQYATKLVTYDIGGAKVLERYCQKHYDLIINK
jgi:hypothetical protein